MSSLQAIPECIGTNFGYKFLRRISETRGQQENVIYEILDFNETSVRACTSIKISYYGEFGFIPDGSKILEDVLKYYNILFQGIPVQNVGSPLTIDNVTWLVAASGDMRAVYEVDSTFYPLDLSQCFLIWGTPPSVKLNMKNRLKRKNLSGRTVRTPIVAKSYFDFLLERDKRLKEVRQLFEVGSHPMFSRCHEVLECFERQEYFIFIVMDRQSGYTLRNIIGDSPDNYPGIDENENTKKFFYRLLAGLAYWHDKGKAHTDIRPENILCERGFGSPKIINFGLSKPLTEDDNIGMVDMKNPLSYPIGTMAYKLTDSREDENYSDIKSDILSFGITMYEVLYGARPFISFGCPPKYYRNSTRTKYFSWEFEKWALANFNPTLLSSDPSINYGSIFTDCTNMSIDAKNLIAKLMYPDPARRLTAREAMQHPWFSSISKSCDMVEEEEVENIEIVNIGYHPIVWQEKKGLIRYLDQFLSGIRTRNSTSSSHSKSYTISSQVDVDVLNPSTPLKVRTNLIPYFYSYSPDSWSKFDKPPRELTSLFRTVEKQEHYNRLMKNSSDDGTTITVEPQEIISNMINI